MNPRLSTLVALSLVCACVTAGAQTIFPFTPLDPAALTVASRVALDSSHLPDLYLARISTNSLELLDGTSTRWTYRYYSPSRDRFVDVQMVNIDEVFLDNWWLESMRPSRWSVPDQLDTTGASLASARLAARLLASDDFQEYRMNNPDLRPMRAEFVRRDEKYPPPSECASDRPFWSVFGPRIGDSVFVAQYFGGLDTVACSWRFYMDAEHSVVSRTDGDVDFMVSNVGTFAFDHVNYQGSFVVPSGSGTSYLYGAGLWVGARIPSGDTLLRTAVVGYNPNNGASQFAAGDGYLPRTSYSHPSPAVAGWSHDDGRPSAPGMDFPWPLWLRAGDAAPSYMNPGRYVLRAADRVRGAAFDAPAFVPSVSEHYVSRYHDADAAAYDHGTTPIGLQVEENVYANPGGFDHAVYVTYSVVNVSGTTLTDVVLGVAFDFDIGNPANDRSRFYSERPELRTAVAWSATEPGTPAGTLAVTLLETPMVDASGFLDASRRLDCRADGRVGSYRSWTIQTDPRLPEDRYQFMDAGVLDGDIAAGDRRGLLVSPHFTMAPGDTAHLAVAYTVLRNERSAAGTSPGVEARVAGLIDAYYGRVAADAAVAEAEPTLSLFLSPNPARDRLALELRSPRSGAATVELFTPAGEAALTRTVVLDGTAPHSSLDVSSLPNGVYTLVVTSAGARSARSVVIVR